MGAAEVGRKFVDEHCDSMPPGVIEDARLLVSELVTNAVLHGSPDITLEISLDPPLIGISVHDDGPAIPDSKIGPPDLDSSDGRGLMIVDRVSSAWGVISSHPSPGKT